MSTSLINFPFTITPLNNITPLTYRDGATFVEILYMLRDYINLTLRPEFDAEMTKMYTDFQTGVANAEAWQTSTDAAHVATYNAFRDSTNAAITAFENTINGQITAFETTTNTTVAANLASMQAAHTTFVNAVNAEIASISNRVGPENMHRLLLTADTVQNVDVVWPSAHPIMFQVTQDNTGGHTLTFGPGITGTLDLDLSPNALTEFQLVPDGAGLWVVHTLDRDVMALVNRSTSKTAGALSALFVKKSKVYLSDYLNPARVPGTTDDLAAFQAAKTALPAGGTLYIPPGHYKITNTLDFTVNDITVEAWGAFIEIVDDGTATGKHISATNADGFTWKGGTLTQTAAARTSVYGLMSLFNVTNVELDRLSIIGSAGTGVYAQQGSVHHYIGVKVKNTKADGIHVSRGITDVQIDSPYVIGAGDDGVAIISVLNDGATNYSQIERVTINEPIVRDSFPIGNGVTFVGAKNCTLNGGVLSNLVNDGVKISIDNVARATTPPTGINVNGTVAERCQRGFSFGPSSRSSMSNVQGLDNRDIGIAAIGSTDSHIVGGVFSGNSYGAFVDGGATGVNFIGSDFRHNTTAPHIVGNGLTAGFLNCIDA